ncbi:GNAT family N-acetyltransferase [Paenibacillus sp. YPG26]|uniref:GNAT family N-acetyltransferase n=1 Tax=Paenibacillus sp. YPG26 TaxID=2878915 RepID=UPI00203FF49F|nr:GNAT family N-acetyltransferase [Paenibacillus sp. YPG26]USB32343.1 GNAT family N-acetyltransferase [Paenibacillus sp. YPG26]
MEGNRTNMPKIRLAKKTEFEALTLIWLNATLAAHSFVEREHWEAGLPDMENKWLPMSENYIIEIGEPPRIGGFLSLVDNYLAAIFIDPRVQNEGWGSELLTKAKQLRDSLTLKVYQKNGPALSFYLKHGFVIDHEEVDSSTGEKEYVMKWCR